MTPRGSASSRPKTAARTCSSIFPRSIPRASAACRKVNACSTSSPRVPRVRRRRGSPRSPDDASSRDFRTPPMAGFFLSTRTMKRLRIAVVGYGTAGQCASVCLSRDGHAVEVFERVPVPGPVGAGFLLQPSGLQVLWRMGLLPQVLAHGVPVRRLYGDTACGRAVMDMQYDGLDPRLSGVGMQRGALFSILADAWDGHGGLRAGTGIADIDADGRHLCDERGVRHGPYDLVV